MSAPEVVPVNSSIARVLWVPPLRPNGAVIGYNLYIDGHLHGSVDNNSGSYLLRDLLPFTVYDIQVYFQREQASNHIHANMCIVMLSFVLACVLQVEVCTVYACARSNVTQTTTVEDVPADFTMPHVKVIGAR